jgi:hypothetical protein
MFDTDSLRSEARPLLALAAGAALLAIAAYGLWDSQAWNTPIEYGNLGYDADTMAVLAQIKAASQGDFPPLLTKTVPQLGAPFTANWNDAPMVEQLLFWLTGCLASVTSLFFAANAMVVLSHVLAALSFYAVCRALDCDLRWSFAGALIFAFARFPFARQLHHPQVLYDWHIPACLLVGWWILDGPGFKLGDRRFWIAVAIAAATGVQHPYYTNMFVQLTGLACLVQLARGNRTAAVAGITVCGAAMAAFLLMCGNYLYFKLAYGSNPSGLVRMFQWLEFYALKPLDMLMPPPDHRFGPFAKLAQGYFENVLVPGETPPSSYLGIIGIASLVWLATTSVRNAMSRPARALPGESWQILWILAYSIVGGLNCLVGVFGIQLFRSANRYSIFILAIVLIWAVRQLSRLRLQAPAAWALPALAVAVALWDQVPPPPTSERMADIAARVDSDRQFTRELESRLPDGGMIFQLPVMRYPEQPAPGVSASDHFRPYLYSNTLRFSFGSFTGRPDTAWQEALTKLDLAGVIRELEKYGFGAIYINRSGFKDRGAQLLKALADLGKSQTFSSPGDDLVAVMLDPAKTPELPPLPGTANR